MKSLGITVVASFAFAALSQERVVTSGPLGKVTREVYVKHKKPGWAPWVWVYTGEPGYREEIHTEWSHETQKSGYGDTPMNPHRRVSHDDGKTWSALTPLPQHLTAWDKVAIIDWKFCGIYDPASQRHVDLSIHHLRDMRQGPPRRIYNHALIRLSSDGGRSFGPPEMLRYEKGRDFSFAKDTLLDPDFLKNNIGYPGQSIMRHSNGSLIVPVTNAKIPTSVDDAPVGRSVWPEKHGIGSLCHIGRWNVAKQTYEWQAGKPVWLSRDDAFNGLLEADVAELRDERVLIVWRVTKNGREKPAYKWHAVSEDGGFTFSQPKVFRYRDGSHFFSNSTFHRLFRSRKTGKLYWIGNILPQNTTNPGHPRYPLNIAEVDEKTLGLIRETVTQIDTRHEGEGERLQLSNFWIIESQAQKNLEIYLTRLNEDPTEAFNANVYRYTVEFAAGR